MQLTVDEQEALARAAQRLGEAASQGRPVDARTQLDLFGMANQVAKPAWRTSARGRAAARHPRADLRGVPRPRIWCLPLPVAELWKLPNVVGEPAVDLVVDFGDQPGIIARGRLEDAPMGWCS